MFSTYDGGVVGTNLPGRVRKLNARSRATALGKLAFYCSTLRSPFAKSAPKKSFKLSFRINVRRK